MWTALVISSFACGALLQEPEPELALELRVNAAIARGVRHLEQHQREDGTWPGEEQPHPGGMTALCCYTLVKSGLPLRAPALQRGLAASSDFPAASTYSTAVHLLLLESLRDPERYRPQAERDREALLSWQIEGLWAYPSGGADLSNTQFALLGLLAAHRMGLDVPDATLESCAKAVLRLQDASGGLMYVGDREATGGMTAASLAGLAVIAEIGAGRPIERWLKKSASDWKRAEQWLERKLGFDRNPFGEVGWTPSFLYPYLWAVERYGGLAGKERIAARDWYREGAEFLVSDQRADGTWGRSLPDTCFALLFLRRASVSPGSGDADADLAATKLERPPELRPAALVPRLRDWLLCGPWGGKPGDDLLSELPFRPERVKPKERGKLERRVWEHVSLKADDWTNLEELTGRHGERLLWALAAQLSWHPSEAEAGTLDARLWLQLEDGWQVWLDGELLSAERRMQAPIEETLPIPLELRAGETHSLLILVEDWRGASAFGARLTDAEGLPLPAGLHAGAEARERSRR
jgi:hypothetical protein